MNAYDFDKTIFYGDSTVKFYCYCLTRTPKMVLRLPKLLYDAVFVLKKDKQRFKQNMFAFLTDLDDPVSCVESFWDAHMNGLKPFYLNQARADDIIISASPEFLIKPLLARFGIMNVLASPVDIHTGMYRGKNCHGEEKVRRLREAYPDAVIDEFYSDSRSDEPMARVANKAFLVKGDRLTAWETY